MHDLIHKIHNLSSTLADMKRSLDLDKKKKSIAKLEKESADPNFWNNREVAQKKMQELGDLNKEVKELESLQEDIKVLSELLAEGAASKDIEREVASLEIRIGRLKISSLLSGPYDIKDAIVTIHAGQGGTEAMDWTSMLYRMYLRFCEKRSWRTEALNLSAGEEAGIKSVTFKVSGNYAYGYLRGEAGTHRLVRQSPFNADRLRQTSFALVEVLPELAEIDLPDIKIRDDDLEWQFFRSSTQGGQNVQKVSTAVRLKHKPTQIAVTSQAERHQEQNRKIALSILRSKLWLLSKEKEKEKKKEIKGEYRPASWGNQIRSYVLHPYKMVKDLRTLVESSEPNKVLDGDLDKFIEAELKLSGTNKD